MKGLIFNIQKFSLHDGPGIRTTLFLKGCPLSCKWCANPESQKGTRQILYNANNCLHCQTCFKACEYKAIDYLNHPIINDKCTLCGKCLERCPAKALSIEGEYKEVDELLEVLLQDKDFYLESGGGVTLSGGEALLQIDFVAELLQKLKDNNIHTAIETTGYVSQKHLDKVIDLIDLFLFDFKHYDSLKHQEATGVKNELIITNLLYLKEKGANILLRLPVIPNFNDSLHDAKCFSDKLNELGFDTIQLLPFHQFGENKYALLNRKYDYQNVNALHEDDLKAYQQVFIENGIKAFF